MRAGFRKQLAVGVVVLVAAALFGAACSTSDEGAPGEGAGATVPGGEGTATPTATPTPIAGLSYDIDALLSPCTDAFAPCLSGFDLDLIGRVGESGDIRLAWILSDVLRFATDSAGRTALEQAFWTLTGVPERSIYGWSGVTNYLIAEDIPPPDGYQRWKSMMYLRFGPEWAPFFDDADADVDWRIISWGGVGIDDRPVEGADGPCFSCIPALNDPELTDAAGGGGDHDERLVFGVEVNGEARAYPKHQMEVHEMVNDTVGGRRLGVVYCTLCGTAQAFLTDELPDGIETPTGALELRTSGLLSRSNKVMFELHTLSFFDTFRGRAVSGPLQDVGLELEQVSVSVATWGEWKAGHPGTQIVAEDAGLGRRYPLDPLGGRDDRGPIFPVGDVDPRLPMQDQVLGVRHDGVTVAFPEIAARVALSLGPAVEFEGIEVRLVAGALAAFTAEGERIVTHQSFWFAWSQFFPETVVWSGS